MDKNTHQPVAWIDDDGMVFWKDGIPPDGTDLFAAQPVPRDVLMAALNEVNSRYMEVCGAQFSDEYIAALADRYASKEQPDRIAPDVMDALVGNDGGRKPDPVNQQLLAELMLALPFVEDHEDSEIYKAGAVKKALNTIRAAIDAAEAAQPVGATCASQSAASESQDGLCRNGEVHASSAQLVAVPEGWQLVPKEPTRAMLDAAHTNFRKDIEIDPLLKTSYRAMLSAAQNPEGGE